MDIENIWRQSNPQDNDLNAMIQAGNFSQLRSRLPLQKLRTNLLTGIIGGIVITLVYLVSLFFIPIWQVNIALVVLIVFNVLILVDSWILYRNTPAFITPTQSLKEELTLHYRSFQRWWRVQERASLFVYPIAVAGGFILGGFLGSEKPVESFLYNSSMLCILGITIIVMVLACYLGARWMFGYAYGKHLAKLKSAIDELS